MIAGDVLASISLIMRFSPARGAGRKQIEWLAYAAALVVAANIAVAFLQSRPQTEALNNDEDGIATLALATVRPGAPDRIRGTRRARG